MDMYKYLYFRHYIWRQLFIQSSLALCFVMFKYFCENFLAVFSVQNQKSVQTILRQCKRDWHTRLEPLHPWEHRNYRKLKYLSIFTTDMKKNRSIVVILAFETEVRDYGNLFFNEFESVL